MCLKKLTSGMYQAVDEGLQITLSGWWDVETELQEEPL